MREQQVNDALHVLDEMHRLSRIEGDEYRQRRRELLESLCDATPELGECAIVFEGSGQSVSHRRSGRAEDRSWRVHS